MVNIFTDLYYLTFVQELNKSLSTWQPTLLPNSKGQNLAIPSPSLPFFQHTHRKISVLAGLLLLTKGLRGGVCTWMPQGLRLLEPESLPLSVRRRTTVVMHA